MRYGILSAVIAAVTLTSTSGEAQARTRPAVITTPKASAPGLVSGTQYAFEVTISPVGELEDPSNFIARRNRSLFILIAPDPPATTDKMPADLLAAMQVYSIGTNKDDGQQLIVDDRKRSKSFLVNGAKNVGIVVTDNYIDSFSDSVFGTVLSGALGLISPLFSLFTGQAIPTLIAGKITDAGTVQTNVQKILTALNRGKNLTRPVRNLRVGTYKIRAEYADVTISIRVVESIALDKNGAFKDDLKAQINAASVKLDQTKLSSSCRGGRYDIASMGFKSPADQAYGLVHLSAHAGFSLKDSIACLTPEYAKVAANAGDRFWSGFPSDFVIKPANLAAKPGEQPSWDQVQKNVDDLITALARYARNETPPDKAVADLKRLLGPKVIIKDNTTSLAIDVDDTPLDPLAAVGSFKSKHYIRFGCYRPNDETTDQSLDKAPAIMLVFKADNNETGTTLETLDTALALRLLFTDLKVTTFAVSDNRAWISAVLKARDYECNGFSVKRPPMAKP
jgi:hypothetical protein